MNACAYCHRPLTDPVSRKRGLGPECWTAVLEKIQRAQADDRAPLGVFAGDVILVRVDGRTYANVPRLFRLRQNALARVEWVWGHKGPGIIDAAVNILSQFLPPIPPDDSYTTQPHPEALICADGFAARFLCRAPHGGCIILQRDILTWLSLQNVPASEIRTFGVLA